MDYEIGTFPCKEGFMRWARVAAPENSRGCVLFWIGWGEWLEKYASTAQAFNTRGFEVIILERRGQGLSSRFMDDRTKGWLPDFRELIADFDAFYAQYFAGESAPLLLAGHSMGAHLLLRWYVEANPPENIHGLILLSPMIRVLTSPFSYATAQLICFFANLFGLGRYCAPGQSGFDQVNVAFNKNVCTRDEEQYKGMIVALRDNPMLKVGGITYGWLASAFRSAEALMKRLRLGAPQGPYLVLGSENDPLVETQAIKEIAALLPNCESHFYVGAAHELLHETPDIRHKVWAEMDKFIGRIIP